MDFTYPYSSLLLKRVLLLKPVLRRDQVIVGIALLIVILLAWLYVGGSPRACKWPAWT